MLASGDNKNEETTDDKCSNLIPAIILGPQFSALEKTHVQVSLGRIANWQLDTALHFYAIDVTQDVTENTECRQLYPVF